MPRNKVDTLPGGQPLYFNNVGLFSDTFLLDHLNSLDKSTKSECNRFLRSHWENQDSPEFSKVYEEMADLWRRYSEILPTLSESQLEDRFIKPILKLLGWEYEVQDRLKVNGRTHIPDYSLFASEEAYLKATKAKTDQAYFSHVLAVADAKALSVDLDGTGSAKTNPSFQIIRYMQDTRCNWGILTNGLYWRLYSLKSTGRHSTFYEINLEPLLASRDDSRFKYFYNFFNKKAFLKHSASEQSFLDVIFENGEFYATAVEDNLKTKLFRVVEGICLGFAADSKKLEDTQLKEIYHHSLYYLFRLMFILNCESKGVLNVGRVDDYFEYSLRKLCAEIKAQLTSGKSASSTAYKTYNAIIELFNLLKNGDQVMKVPAFGSEVFASGDPKFYENNRISDSLLNSALLELACEETDEGELQFIDYKRLSVEHLGSLFEGLLEYSFKPADKKYADIKGKLFAWEELDEEKKASPGLVIIREGQLHLSSSSKERKNTGSYYTPDYIVDYIVENTLAPQTKGKDLDSILQLRIVDPAMGSGHFLIGVIKFLEKEALAFLHEKDRKVETDYTHLRWQILKNCIFGVDINPLAVELAKFSLWMFSAQKRYPMESLRQQLVCGDSLDDSTWDSKLKFAHKGTGFDSVIGNPPYGAELNDDQKKEFKEKFNLGTTDTAALFMVKIKELVKQDGRNGMIVPKSFTYSTTWNATRLTILPHLELLADVSKGWKDVKLEQVIYVLQVNRRPSTYECSTRDKNQFASVGTINKSDCELFGFILNGLTPEEIIVGKKMLANSVLLGKLTSNVRGGMFQASVKAKASGRRVVGGKQLSRFSIDGEKGFVSESVDVEDNAYPEHGSILVQNIVAHIEKPVSHIKIIGTLTSPADAREVLILDTVNQITNKSEYSNEMILGLLMSLPINWYVYRFICAKAIRTIHFDSPVSDRIPFPKISKSDSRTCDDITALVEECLNLRSRNPERRNTEIIQKLSEIDKKLYDLFSLSKSDIECIEASRPETAAITSRRRRAA